MTDEMQKRGGGVIETAQRPPCGRRMRSFAEGAAPG
jgi:hypothetical protein